MKKLLFAFVAFAASLVVLAVGLPSQLMGWANSSAGEGWDGTVTTSLDEATVGSISDLDNLVLTFPGASTLEVLDEEECQYMALVNEDGSEMYGLWAPTMGSDYTIDGNQITLGGFMPMDGVTVAIPEGTTKLYIEDYGTLAIDGNADYIETIELKANIAGGVEPFMLTSVSNNGVNGNVMSAVEASENGVSKNFVLTATGKTLSKGTAEATLSKMEGATEFGAATVTVNGSEAVISFNSLNKSFFTQAGTYVLSIPEGVVVDENDAPNTAISVRWAIIEGEEPVVTGLVNADFAEGVVGDVNIATYEKDGSVNRMQPVFDWSFGVENGDARAAGVVAYGSGTTLGGSTYGVPDAGPEGTNGNALAMVGVWTGTVQYVQNVTLPAGKYTMTVPVYNTAGNTAFVKNLIGVKIGETENYAATTKYNVGQWTNETIVFELAEETEVTVSVGYQGANVGSSASQHLFIDCVKIEAYDELAVAKAAAIAALPVGNESIFTPAAEDVEAAKTAIEAAASVEDLEAVVAAIDLTAPALSGEWMIKNANGEFYLGEAKLSDAPVAVTFEAVEGGYAIKAGEVYVNMLGTNNWSMTTGEAATTAWNFNLAEGKYTIQGPKGMIGTDALEDGAATYGNKAAGNNGLWTIEEYVAPILVTPALLMGEEEYTLNNHMNVSVEEAEAIKVDFENGAAIKLAMYSICDAIEEDGELTYGDDLATGVLSLNTIGYAEFEEAVKFEQGKQYYVRIMAWDNEDPTSATVATYECMINGAYVAPIEITPALLMGEEEMTLNTHINVSVEEAEAIKVNFENGAAIKLAMYSICDAIEEDGELTYGDDLATGVLSLNNIGYAEFEEAVKFEQGKQYYVRIMAWDNEDPTSTPVATYECMINGAYVESMVVTPAFLAGEEEITLNSHSAVTVDYAEALKVNFENAPEVIGATYAVNEMVMGEDEEGIFWYVGKELAAGEMSVNSIGYTELDKALAFAYGKKYQLSVSVFVNAEDPTEIGTYTFEFNGSAEVGDVVMEITDAQYGTFFAPFAVTIPEGVNAYTVPALESDGSKLVMFKIKDNVIPANTPVVVYSETEVYETFSGAVVDGSNVEGLLTGTLKATNAPVGSYVLQNHGDGKVGFCKVEDGVEVEVAANRAYLTAPASDVKAFYLNDATAIKALESLMAGKAQIFDLNGRQQSKLQKGINIVNGVKVLVK